jgi:hypothetical protein
MVERTPGPDTPPRRRSDRRPTVAVIDDELAARALQDDDGGVAWRLLSDALVEYGMPWLLARVRSGDIVRHARKLGVQGMARLPDELRYSGREAESLVHEILVDALRTFRDKCLPDWEPGRGLKLTSYWLNWCLMLLPDAYQRWYRREVRPRLGTVSADVIAEAIDRDPLAEDIACARRTVQARGKEDPLAQRIVLMRDAGFRWPEILEDLSAQGTPITAREARRRVRKLFVAEFESRESAE